MKRSLRLRSSVALAVILLSAGLEAPAAQGSDTAIMDKASSFRCLIACKTVEVKRATGPFEFVKPHWSSRGSAKLIKVKEPLSSKLPPKTWNTVTFDDGPWARVRCPLYTRSTRGISLICARGKFEVTDPAQAGELKLSLVYRGGIRVYVNGKEVARGHLQEGEIHLDTPAEVYSKEAYVAPNGKQLRWVGFGDPEKYKDQFALRDRKLSVAIPADALRKGANVIALEVHRAPVSEIFYTAKFKGSSRHYLWDQIGLERVNLTAPAKSSAKPNTKRPADFQVWRHPVAGSAFTADFGEPSGDMQPVTIAGARNGSFSGQVVAGSSKPIKGLKTTAGDLKGPGGGTIPAASVLARYGVPGGSESRNESSRGRAPVAKGTSHRFDGLLETPPAEVPVVESAGGAVVPIWITVRVPGDAKPGYYSGKLTISAEGVKPVEVPVSLSVADWELPESTAYASWMGLIQSPDSLAMNYNVKMWSEEHWKLIDRSFELLGKVGCKTLYIPVIRRTYFGNEHSRVRWIKQEDGSFKYDFTIVERYVDTAMKHLGKIPVVCFYCWDVGTGAAYYGKKQHSEVTGAAYTVLDPKTGTLEKATGPKWGEPASPKFWKPVLDGLRALLKKRGLEKSMMIGISGDRQPLKPAVADLKAAAPNAPWVSASHSTPSSVHGQPVGYMSGVWGLISAPDPTRMRCYGWRNPTKIVAFPRSGSGVNGSGLRLSLSPVQFRTALERCVTARGRGRKSLGLRGIGRCGADFWPLLKAKRGKKPILGRYEENADWHGGWLHNSIPYCLWPGKDGPVATVQYENLREGIQENEARVFIERALLDKAKREKLGAELARKCQAVLDERVRVNNRVGLGCYLTWAYYVGSGVTERAEKLFEAAAEVAAKLK